MYLDSRDVYDDGGLTSPPETPIVCIGNMKLEKAVIIADLATGARWTAVHGDGDKFLSLKSMRECLDMGIGKDDFQFRELGWITWS
jgi:hypothetical protein